MQSVLMKARMSLEKKGVFAHGALPEAIANSWHRCLEQGLDPKGKPVDAVISYQDLTIARERHEKLIAVVRPELELLSNQIAGTNFMTAFADCDGVVLEAIMDNEFRNSECSRSVRPGSVWREDLRGTNALGLTLFSGETSMVTGPEHFFASHTGVSCISAPIFDGQGRIVGLLDASSEIAARQFHTRALVALAATNIENRLFVEDHRGDNIIQFHPREEYLATQSVGMISLHDDGSITGFNRRAGEILSGLDLDSVSSFSEIFQGGFGTLLSAMAKGAPVRLTDWLNASYFARIRMTRPLGLGARRTVTLAAPSVYDLPKTPGAPVCRDEVARHGLRLAQRSVRLGLPFCIIGARGSGRTTFAKTVHEACHRDLPLVAVDCQAANPEAEAGRLAADILGGDGTGRLSTEAGGTLLLENLSSVRGQAAETLAQIANRFLQTAAAPRWTLMATDTARIGAVRGWPANVRMAFSRITQMEIHLPLLSERTDFQQISVAMLSAISPAHRLSNTGVDALERLDRPKNLIDLETQLRVLAVQCPVGVIRQEHVERYLGRQEHRGDVCARCQGNSAREAKCREINRVLLRCNGNVALAARSLGVSRNTVYSHQLA